MKRKPRVDPDGVRVVYAGRSVARWLVVLGALAAVGLLVAWLSRSADESAQDPSHASGAAVEIVDAPTRDELPAVRRPTPMPRAFTVRRSVPSAPPRPVPSAVPASDEARASEEEPTEILAGDYIEALREDGETAGLAAFPPPGTRPPRSGLVVPDDYVLPEGFARHYQTTDDGERLEPILALAPGYDLLDETGEPVTLLDDRIVPPEFAPPDLPVQILEVPASGRR